MIPVFKVNYTFGDIISAFFISNSSSKWRDKLQNQIAETIGNTNILLSSSCRNSLKLLFESLSQKTVIIPAYTCEVVAEAATLAGKKIEFAHVSKETLNVTSYPKIDEDKIIVVTHQYGNPTYIKEIINICKEKKAIIIEDCAGSLGSKISGVSTGNFGDFAVFSFSASKTLQSPTRGSFIVMNKLNERLKELISNQKGHSNSFKIKMLLKALTFKLHSSPIFCSVLTMLLRFFRRKGNTEQYYKHPVIEGDFSYGKPLYEWQAYILSKQFNQIENIFRHRRLITQRYNDEIQNPWISKIKMDSDAVNIRYPILVNNRTDFVNYCVMNGIQVGTGFNKPVIPPGFEEELEINRRIVYLPIGYKYSNKDIDKVIRVINLYKK